MGKGEYYEELKIKEFEDFIAKVRERMEKGVKEYGPGTFMNIDSIAAALEELEDLVAYVFFTYFKLKLFGKRLKEEGEWKI